MFFSLSGFLICNQLIKYFQNDFSRNQLISFYKNRWLRTIPFYIFFVLLNYCLYLFLYKNSNLNYLKTDFNLFRYLTFTQNLTSTHSSFFPEVWPLPIEEWSYLLLPLPFFVLSTFKKNNLDMVISALIIALGLIIAMRINYIYSNSPEQDWELRKVVIYRLDAILYGAILAILCKQYSEFFIKYKNVLILIGCLSGVLINELLFKTYNTNYNILLFIASPLTSCLLVPYFYYTQFNISKTTKLSTHISVISYSILLCHLYFIQFSLLSIFNINSFASANIITLAYFIIVVLFSTLFYNVIERPILLLRKK